MSVTFLVLIASVWLQPAQTARASEVGSLTLDENNTAAVDRGALGVARAEWGMINTYALIQQENGQVNAIGIANHLGDSVAPAHVAAALARLERIRAHDPLDSIPLWPSPSIVAWYATKPMSLEVFLDVTRFLVKEASHCRIDPDALEQIQSRLGHTFELETKEPLEFGQFFLKHPLQGTVLGLVFGLNLAMVAVTGEGLALYAASMHMSAAAGTAFVAQCEGGMKAFHLGTAAIVAAADRIAPESDAVAMAKKLMSRAHDLAAVLYDTTGIAGAKAFIVDDWPLCILSEDKCPLTADLGPDYCQNEDDLACGPKSGMMGCFGLAHIAGSHRCRNPFNRAGSVARLPHFSLQSPLLGGYEYCAEDACKGKHDDVPVICVHTVLGQSSCTKPISDRNHCSPGTPCANPHYNGLGWKQLFPIDSPVFDGHDYCDSEVLEGVCSEMKHAPVVCWTSEECQPRTSTRCPLLFNECANPAFSILPK